jgi:hypothetical protein
MTPKTDLKTTFFSPILRQILVIMAGFFVAPTPLLYTFYQEHAAARWIAILLGALIAIAGLFGMLSISIKAMGKLGD